MANEEDLKMVLNIINKTIQPSPDPEEQKQVQILLTQIIENPTSFPIFYAILTSNSYSDSIELYAFSGLKSWLSIHWHNLSDDDKLAIITQNLLPLIFTPKQYGSHLRNIFFPFIKDPVFSGLWANIIEQCPEILSQKDLSADVIVAVLENLIKISKLVTRYYHDRNRKELFYNFLAKIYELSQQFLNPEYIQSKEGCKILELAVHANTILTNLALANELNPIVESYVVNFSQFVVFLLQSIESLTITDELISLLKTTSIDYLGFLQSLSSIESDLIRGSCQIPQLIQEFRSKIEPQISTSFFTSSLYLFSNNLTNRFSIGLIILPLTWDIPSFQNLDQVITVLLEYLTIDPNDQTDFFENPGLFYQMNYSIVRSDFGNLRNNALLISELIFDHLDDLHIYAHLFQDVISLSESGAMLVSHNMKRFFKLGLQQYVSDYASRLLHFFTSSSIDLNCICSLLYFCSKFFGKNYDPDSINKLMAFALKSLDYSMPILNALVYRFLYSFYKRIRNTFEDSNSPFLQYAAFFADPGFFLKLLESIEHRVSNEVLKLMKFIAQDFPASLAILASNGTHLIELIIVELNSESSEFDNVLIDYKRLGLTILIEIVADLINHFSDKGLEAQIQHLLNDCVKYVEVFSIEDSLFRLIASLLRCNSQLTDYCLNIILSRSIKSYLVQSVPIFLLCFSKNSPEFNSRFIPPIYQYLLESINKDEIYDKIDHFMLCVMLCWIFQTRPEIINSVDVQNTETTLSASFFYDYLTAFANKEAVTNETYWAFAESAYFNLVITLTLIQKASMTKEQIESWFSFLHKHYFLRLSDLEFHSRALSYFLQKGFFDETNALAAAQIIQNMNVNPNLFLENNSSSYFSQVPFDKEFETHVLSYPIMSILG